MISISGSKHVKNPNIYYHQPEEVSGLFEVVESLDMEDLKLTQLFVNISTWNHIKSELSEKQGIEN